jgi:hypothetical protein
VIGHVASLHRYPVKSMLGESLDGTEFGRRGVVGDRRYAVIDATSGLVGSAKQPRAWGGLLQCSAATTADGAVTITLPAGDQVAASDPAASEALSSVLGRDVRLSSTPPVDPHLERLWPDVEGLAPVDVIAQRGTVTPLSAAAPGTFFDYAPVHLLTTASLGALASCRPGVDFSAARFRPNIVIDTGHDGFVENDWAGAHLVIGDVRLEVLTPTPRCAVPSAAHGALPASLDVLRGVVAANRLALPGGRFACVGVYARVVAGGSIAPGDPVAVER